MEEIQALDPAKGISSMFQVNPGGHHNYTVERTATEIHWFLNSEIVLSFSETYLCLLLRKFRPIFRSTDVASDPGSDPYGK